MDKHEGLALGCPEDHSPESCDLSILNDTCYFSEVALWYVAHEVGAFLAGILLTTFIISLLEVGNHYLGHFQNLQAIRQVLERELGLLHL